MARFKAVEIATIAVKPAVSSVEQPVATDKPVAVAEARARATAAVPSRVGRRRRACRVAVDVTSCRYAIVRRCLRARDYRLVKRSAEPGTRPPPWDIWWSDRGDQLRDLPRLSPFQKVNHFPAMEEICRKDFLANNLNGIAKVLSAEFDYFPRSFLVPAERVELQRAMETAPKNATFIVKPRALCQGKGISLIQSFAKLPPNEACVVQRYIDNPLLIDGFKFDLRIYVLVASVAPLKLHIFRNGLARFCTTPFQKPTRRNLGKKRMHLTNYAINKNSKNFQKAGASGSASATPASKRSLIDVMQYLDSSGRCSSQHIWQQICDLVIKTLVSIEPKLQATYKSYFASGNASTQEANEAQWGPKCFEILGFDVMLDNAGKAWLVEVNHAPSFAGDSPLDREVKSALISATLEIVAVTNEKKRQFVAHSRSDWTKRLWSTQVKTKKAAAAVDEVVSAMTPSSGTPEVCADGSWEIRKPGGNGGEQQQEDGAGVDLPAADEEEQEEQEEDEEAVESEASTAGDSEEDDCMHEPDNNQTTTTAVQVDPVCNLAALGSRASGLKTLLSRNRRNNRISPEESTRTDPRSGNADGIEFANAFSVLYPDGDHLEQARRSETQDRYDRIRAAADVNKSKLWN